MAKITRVRDLTPDADNANKGTERGSGMLEQSLREYGAGRSVLVDRKGRIIAGNKTVEAAAAIGIDKVQVIETDGSTVVVVQRMDLDLERDKKARELGIADNRSSQVGLDWDKDVLREIDADLGKFFLENELEDILNAEDADSVEERQVSTAADELAEKWGTKPGQIWTAGSHRLMCGDATIPEHIAALMAGAKAHLVVTDPPYGVSYSSAVTGKVKNDERRDDDLCRFLATAFGHLAWATTPSAPFYIWHASSTRRDFEDAMLRAGLRERQYITWVKDSFVLGHADYQWQSEPCFYAAKDGEKNIPFYGDRRQSTTWRIANVTPEDGTPVYVIGNGVRISDTRGHEILVGNRLAKDKKLRLLRAPPGSMVAVTKAPDSTDIWQVGHDEKAPMHPTQKPTELAARAIRNSSKEGEIVLDTFLGAGFTLMGAHHTGRACYGMELEPKYLAVCLERLACAGTQPELAQ